MKKSNCYAVVSGKGGTGKTTVCAALASALSILSRKVCVVDLDVGLHNLDLALGLQDRSAAHARRSAESCNARGSGGL